MSITDYLVAFIGIAFSVWLNLLCYKSVSSNKKSILSIKVFILIIIETLIIISNTYFGRTPFNTIFFNVITLIIIFYLVFKEKRKTTAIKGIIVYLFSMIFEILFSIIILFSDAITTALQNQNLYLKNSFSILVLLTTYFILNIKSVNKLIMKVDKLSQKTKEIVLVLIIFISFIILDLRFVDSLSRDVYFTNVLLAICFIFLVVSSLYNANKVKTEIEKTECLLEIMTKYEKIIDEDRINRHEMYNNLLILKSYENKNSKRYIETLDSLIKTYDFKGRDIINNMDKLPTGLKGIIYFKLKSISKSNINLNVHISKNIKDVLKLIDDKDYIRLCKLVCIAIDNAIEASIISKAKLLVIDIYKTTDKVIVSIENSFDTEVDIEKINDKYYSSKGENRGLGLYIAKKFIEDSNNITMNQEIDKNIFITKIELNTTD